MCETYRNLIGCQGRSWLTTWLLPLVVFEHKWISRHYRIATLWDGKIVVSEVLELLDEHLLDKLGLNNDIIGREHHEKTEKSSTFFVILSVKKKCWTSELNSSNLLIKLTLSYRADHIRDFVHPIYFHMGTSEWDLEFHDAQKIWTDRPSKAMQGLQECKLQTKFRKTCLERRTSRWKLNIIVYFLRNILYEQTYNFLIKEFRLRWLTYLFW